MPRKFPLIDDAPERPSLFRRFAVLIYDSLLLIGIFFVATALILPFNAGQAFNATQYFYPAYLYSISFVFYGWFWTHGGQTLGARAWKISVLSLDLQPISWRQATIRYLCLSLTLGLDLLLVIFNNRYLALHERLSNSSVFVSAN